ncbi:MAG: metal-dependent hydrolase [Myxococcales bacterium]|nr:metal-dependent hydrolase [Myxococcales bacterium]
MANFSTHMVGAAATGVVAAALLSSAHLLTVQSVPAAVGMVALGGIFPDVDSDNSDSIKLVFNLLGVSLAVPVLVALIPTWGLLLSLVAMGVVFAFVRYGIVVPFRRFTVHRGLFHSVPMGAGLTGVVALVCHSAMGLDMEQAWVFAAMFLVGFMTHLVLDEMYSVDLANNRIKRSFGSALKLFEGDEVPYYVALYAAMALSLYVAPSPEDFVQSVASFDVRLLPDEPVRELLFSGLR